MKVNRHGKRSEEVKQRTQKTKKTEAERLKAKSALSDLQIISPRDKGASKKP
jgi:hypothetical protein